MVFFQIKLQLNILFFKELFINLILLFSTLFSSLPPFYLPLRRLRCATQPHSVCEEKRSLGGRVAPQEEEKPCLRLRRAERRQEPSKRVKKELRLPKTGIEPVSNSYKGFVLAIKLFRLLFLFLELFRAVFLRCHPSSFLFRRRLRSVA